MIVFRLSKAKYGNDLSGSGVEKSGGRWNSKGTAMVYTSISRALCTAEIAVHTPLGNIPSDYVLVTIEIPDDLRISEIKKLPPDWKLFPHPGSTQKPGDRFVAGGKSPVMKVPSAVVQGEYNFLINPRHEDAVEIKIVSTEPFTFDERLFKK